MSEKKPSLFSAVAPPVLAAGAGALAGGIAGGLGARTLLQAPGIRARLAKMTPARRKEVARAIELVGAPIIGTAGAVGSMATREYLDAKMQERRKMEAELAARSRGAT